MKNDIAELDNVALLKDHPEHKLIKGDVGCVTAILDREKLQVEFVDDAGQTRALVNVSRGDVLRLNLDLSSAQ